MIDEEKRAPALLAMNAILVAARSMALEKEPHEEIAHVLDCAELLPMLFLEEDDRTEFFREMLVDLADRHERFRWALQRFDEE